LAQVALAAQEGSLDRYSERQEDRGSNLSLALFLLPEVAEAEQLQQRVKHLQVAHPEMELMQAVRYLPVMQVAAEVAVETQLSVETVQPPAGALAAMVELDRLRP